MRAVAALLVCWLLPQGIAHAHDCAPFDVAVSEVAAAHAQLMAVPSGEDLDPLLTAAAQQGIERSKAAIARLVSARMACGGAAPDGRTVESDLNGAMQALGAACDKQCADNPYHDAPRFEVLRDKAHPQLLAIVARLTIVCGADAGLFVYEHADGTWRERVRWQSAPYEKVSGAFEALDFRVAPADGQGNWYVLVKDIMPWCSSTWSTVRYTVLRPATGQAAQKIVFRGADSIWWGGDDTGRISAAAQSFDIRFHSSSIDLGIHNREWIRHYAIVGDTVQRVQPVALTPRDFADEWIVSPWAQARDWSLPDMRAVLEDWHERMRGHGLPSYEFEAIHACYDHPHHFEVDLVDQRDQAEYFLSIEGRLNFTVSGVAQRSNPPCKGDDLLGQMQTR